MGFVNDALKAISNPFAKGDHDLIVLRITLTLAGLVGYLSESMFKRSAGV